MPATGRPSISRWRPSRLVTVSETIRPRAQPRDRSFDGLRQAGRQPGTEGKHAAGSWPVTGKFEIALDIGLLARPRPSDDDLGFGAKKKLGAVELRAHRHKLRCCLASRSSPAPPLGEIKDRDESGKK